MINMHYSIENRFYYWDVEIPTIVVYGERQEANILYRHILAECVLRLSTHNTEKVLNSSLCSYEQKELEELKNAIL